MATENPFREMIREIRQGRGRTAYDDKFYDEDLDTELETEIPQEPAPQVPEVQQAPEPEENPFRTMIQEMKQPQAPVAAPVAPEEPSFLGNVGDMLSQSGTQFKANLSSYLLTRQWEDLDD
ncbi:MAG: hypothetical protein OES12_11165, partial [Anaerolineae bacterium]|nr:hypothetical protein [Anaerolineae bacterium]